MNERATPDAYGVLAEPANLTVQRLLPGPIERVWAYLTEGELRAQWLAAGRMKMQTGAPFEFVWRNDELADPPGQRPPGFSDEHRMQSRITEFDPPRKLAFTWQGSGDVSFELDAKGSEVLLTVIHRRLPDRATLLGVGAGWHAHLDVLVARATGRKPGPFWDGWSRLEQEYDRRLPKQRVKRVRPAEPFSRLRGEGGAERRTRGSGLVACDATVETLGGEDAEFGFGHPSTGSG